MAITQTGANALLAANSQSDVWSQIQDAAQSLINGATGKPAMDVSGLVSVLVNAKTAGQAAEIKNQAAWNNTQISALGALKLALSNLKTGVEPLSDGTLAQKFTSKASGKGLTTTVDAGTVAGSYQVEVKQVARSQTLVSAGFDPKQKLGSGTLTLKIGERSTSIDIDATNNTPAGIAAAINSAKNNPGVTATVVTGTDGAHLVLRSTAPGSANVINVSVSNVKDDAGLSGLAVKSTADDKGGKSAITSAGDAWKQSDFAQDAIVTVGGVITARSADNAVKGVIAGVTINVTEEAIGAPQTLSIARDIDGQARAVTNFVDLYNSMIGTMAQLTSFDKTAKPGQQGGPMIGDSMLNGIRNSLAHIVGGGVPHGDNKRASLAALGITFARAGDKQPEGSLIVDKAKLNEALQSNPQAVEALFNKTNGIGTQVTKALDVHLRKDGSFDVRSNAIDRDMKSVAQRQARLETYAAQLSAQYKAQFTALDALMARMQQNTSYLTQLFGGANSSGALANNK
ncbi:flagellar filament capping protein FliD [Burkholderia thailandensis]|uniref:Flagellar hook-associated protein 2 n=1 Tax=Burkholderia thailandensis TaxID=57975 RepID=A0AAW9CPV0_BURTH|nr:flagellar filament capping protein FliD [Burkholderia thailandensis]MCS3392106.1 flagellar filament capping protein FliD [Burkholderia thailandensis]MCS6425104.1 flagellar filament capping protein FliD [Burkholderia thailandensis]MCS6453176.1 flagellar filament capping protein FliD [Burkholderia thailandensis]MCS6464503.1 flagellar filament capping protein FliD [Burkholderia thailandensis]MCS6482273.1 flagellar filament capping protein FliD [Burkholderia thailandensis]